MPKTDKRVDLYIGKSADFAQPILTHLRKLVHATCPKAEETIKWGFPHFEYSGGMLCHMAAFKQHCGFGFWKANELQDPYNLLTRVGKTTMGSFGKITHVSELPGDKILKQYIKEAMKLNEAGKKESIEKVHQKATDKELAVPDYFLSALKKNKKALVVFEQFSPSNKKEYIEWLEGAKTETTKNKRMGEALDWIAEGKSRHWKYKK